MKKTNIFNFIFTFSLLISSVQVSTAQIWTTMTPSSFGVVPPSVTPLSPISIGDAGATDKGIFVTDIGLPTTIFSQGIVSHLSTPTSGGQHKYAISAQVESGVGWAHALRGVAYNATPTTSGRTFGANLAAGNATSGYNYGLHSVLLGSNDGTAILGWDRINYPTANEQIPGQFAGYFIGQTCFTQMINISNGGITFPDNTVQTTAYIPGSLAGKFMDGAVDPTDAMYDLGQVGVGLNNPLHQFEVFSDDVLAGGTPASYILHNAPLGTNADAIGLRATNNTDDFYGIGLEGLGGSIGTRGKVEPIGNQMYIGAEGDAFHTDADGCMGNNTATGVGVYGRAHRNGINYGVWGEANDGETNYGIYGTANTSCGTATSYAGYFNGDVHATGQVTWTSDKKFKREIEDIPNATDIIQQLRPTTYKFAQDEYKMINLSQGKQYGFIAQELQTVLPELVKENVHHYVTKNDETDKFEASRTLDYLGVDYVSLIPVLTKGMQEQNAVIEKLEETVSSQKKAVEALENQVNQLTELVEAMLASNSNATINSQELILNQAAKLAQNYPNPFHDVTSIKYFIPSSVTDAKIQVTTLKGEIVETAILNEIGNGILNIKKENYPAGSYIYTLILDGKIFDSKKMIISW